MKYTSEKRQTRTHQHANVKRGRVHQELFTECCGEMKRRAHRVCLPHSGHVSLNIYVCISFRYVKQSSLLHGVAWRKAWKLDVSSQTSSHGNSEDEWKTQNPSVSVLHLKINTKWFLRHHLYASRAGWDTTTITRSSETHMLTHEEHWAIASSVTWINGVISDPRLQ